MPDMTRRNFLGLSTCAVGASALGGPVFAESKENPRGKKNAKIYTVFTKKGLSHDDSSLKLTTNEEILTRLQRECEGVDFVVRDLTKSANVSSVLNEIEDLKKLDYDGVVIFGDNNLYKLALTGLVRQLQQVPHAGDGLREGGCRVPARAIVRREQGSRDIT